jgi:cyclopropane-fatty-acyl-phospholipid synthase
MTYSSALFDNPGQESLEKAQTQKYASMVDQMGAQPGDHVLEIGCGWGGFAEYAAKERGLRVTGLTISQAQHDYAVDRIARRACRTGSRSSCRTTATSAASYDGIARSRCSRRWARRYWPVYFASLRDRLKPGRHATLQIITVQDKRWQAYRAALISSRNTSSPAACCPRPGPAGRGGAGRA